MGKISNNSISLRRTIWGTSVGTLALGLGGILLQAAAPVAQKTFASPQEAIQATIEAAEHNDTSALLQLFGPQGKDIVESGDAAQDKDLRAEFAHRAHEKLQIDQDRFTPNRVTFSVGSEAWPFPVPLLRKDGKWRFDSASARVEILARRVGKNELDAIEECRGYAEAQIAFAAVPHDGDHVLKYASNVSSSKGKHDGLYSGTTGDNFVSQAFTKAVVNGVPAGVKPEPFNGYYFRVLKAQGDNADGGAFDYVVNGKMIGGFGLVAWPAEYGVSGVRTFIINHEGEVYEKDLGPTTAVQARQITKFNPNKSWRPVLFE